MYLPNHFHQTDRNAIFDLMERHSFATVVSMHNGEPLASHLPILVDRAAGPNGTLIGHLARANPQHLEAAGKPTLVIFSGPHAYISPTWYAEPNVVPTWNYQTVHAYGTWQTIDDHAAVKQIVADTVRRYESGRPQPWPFDDSSPLADALVKQIVGFRIVVDRLEAKWKLNQNHSETRRRRVIAALEEQGNPDDLAIAEAMRKMLS